ncbi:MAG: HYR domain-containing protein [Chitinophagaceae bacterium]|nr:HYR domain-containing protein [Chitinophagaceae bacterium]
MSMFVFTRQRLFAVLTATCLFFVGFTANAQTAGALQFDGVNDYVAVPSSINNRISEKITVEAWIKPDAGAQYTVQSVATTSSYYIPNGFIFPRTDNNWNTISFYMLFNGDDQWTSMSASFPNPYTWHHVAATYDGAYMRIYVDGNLVNSMPKTGTVTVYTNPLTIGNHGGYNTDAEGPEYYKGSMDEFRIWNRALSECEIRNNMNCQISTAQTGLNVYYQFNQGLIGGANFAESTLKDSRPNVVVPENGALYNFDLNGATSNYVAGKVTGTCAVYVPPTLSVSSNGPSLGTGSTIQLSATGTGTFVWTGPNGFNSTQQNPSITGAGPAASGVYTVTLTTPSGCKLSASTTIQIAPAAGALNLDGVNDFISIPNAASLNPAAAITLEAWIFPTDSLTPVQSVVAKSTDITRGYIFPRTDDGWKSFSFYLNIEGLGWRIISATYDKINRWNHVAATYDGFFMKIYLNGELKSTLAVAGNIATNSNAVTIGTQLGVGGEYFKGNVDEIRIWNRALDKCEIQNNMTCELGLPQNGLSAYYRFNQGFQNINNTNITTITDLSGNSNTGALVNFGLSGTSSNFVAGKATGTCSVFTPITVTATSNGPLLEVGSSITLSASGGGTGAQYSWTGPNNFTSNQANNTIPNAQIINSGTYTVSLNNGGCTAIASTNVTVAFKAGSLDLDGVDDEVVVPHSSSLNIKNEITLESWIYPTDNSKNMVQDVLCKSTLTNNTGYIFPRTNDGWRTLSFYLHLNGQWKILTTQAYPGINSWHHVAATYDGYYMRIYIDGVLEAKEEASGTITQNMNNLIIGRQPGFTNEFYTGKVEEARVWSRALNQCEIINNMNCQLQAQQSNLEAYYQFNQGFVNVNNAGNTSLTDASGKNNTGTLTNFALQGATSNWAEFKVNGTCSTYAEPPVTAQANGSVFGIGSTIRLFASGGTAYTWTGPNNFHEIIPDPFITNAQSNRTGTYTVEIPFERCTIYRSLRLTVTPLPAIQADGNTTICPSNTVNLSIASAGTAYQWYRNDVAIPAATNAVYAAGQTGSYSVAVTVNGNVQISAPIDVTVVDNQAPVPVLQTLPVLYANTPAVITTRPQATDNCRGTILGTTPVTTFTQPGTYTIRWTYDDNNGNKSYQDQDVVVTRSDVTPPVLSGVPANATVNCSNIPAPATVTANDEVDGAVSVSFTEVSTQVADVTVLAHYVYTITRTWTASDANGNTASATQTLSVTDQTAPVLGALTNIVVNNTPGMAGALVNYTAAATDNCGSPVTITYSIASGSLFALGTTTVEVTATDLAGNSSSGSFTVKVNDNEKPVITAPANITVNTNIGVNYASGLNLGTATATDNSGAVTISSTTIPATFPLGVTTIVWTATDAAGNFVTANQTITVRDQEDPVITAPANISVNTNLNQAFATLLSLGTPVASDNSGTVSVSNNAPAQFGIGTTTVIWTATDPGGRTATATQLITVTDNQAPALSAPADITVTTNVGVNYATGVDLGTPVTSDNSGMAVSLINNMPSQLPLGVNRITWKATDRFGNFTEGVQLVTVIDAEAPVFGSINNIVVTAPSGANSVAGITLTAPNVNDNVGVVFIGNNATGTTYGLGTTSIEWTAKDAAGNKTTIIQLVVVKDGTAPVLNNLPVNITVTCGGIPVPAAVTAVDNYDPSVSVNYSESSTRAASANVAGYYNYVITRTWTATDAAGNTTTAKQLITVSDVTAPALTVPGNITASAGANCTASVNFTATAVDACGSPVTITYSVNPGTFGIGTTTVQVTAKDVSGNSISKSFTVTVSDNQPPSITAPANVTALLGAVVNLGTPVVSDNCGNVTVSNNAPASFPLGVTSVVWTATDAAGNTNSATQTVTITNPVNNCSSNITIIPENDTYTGGIASNLYLGYGPQKVTLKVNSTGASYYFYSWRAVSGNGSLSSSSSSAPVFAPSAAGTYTFEVRVTGLNGCTSTSTVTICVKDIRVKDGDTNDAKCDHKSHKSKDCKHGKHKHKYCDHKAHSKDKCPDKYDDGDDDNDECDHRSHDSKNCKHKGHYHTSCDHKSHDSKTCKNKTDKHDDDDCDGDCDHKGHSAKDCKHNGHKHKACDHKGHKDYDCQNHNDDDDDDNEGYNKVYLCHMPPGNSGNPQTLSISVNAVESHLRNHPGDKLGSCAQQGCTVTTPVAFNNGGPVLQTSPITEVAAKTETTVKEQTDTDADLHVTVLGNPSRNAFTLKIQSKHNLPVQIRVMDMNGRTVEAKANQLPNSNVQIGQHYQSGTYFAEIVQGTRRRVVQLIKVQ